MCRSIAGQRWAKEGGEGEAGKQIDTLCLSVGQSVHILGKNYIQDTGLSWMSVY